MTLFLKALACQNKGRPPLWIMRQAGRYLPEYQKLRKEYPLETLFDHPELITEITLQPIKRFGFDAAILFADILHVCRLLGKEVTFPEKKGPQVFPKISSLAEIKLLSKKTPEETLPFVSHAIKVLKQELDVPLIGFAGGPFTVASYMIETESRNLRKTKEWIYTNPYAMHCLLEKITERTIAYLEYQIQAGVDALQIFDSWAGVLELDTFQDFALIYLQKILRALQKYQVPIILFCRGSCLFAKELASISPQGISFDWHRPLVEMRRYVPSMIAIQGNLDPECLKASYSVIRTKTLSLLHSMEGDPGFIVNLGHGILPDIPVDHVRCFVETVQNYQVATGGIEHKIASGFPPD